MNRLSEKNERFINRINGKKMAVLQKKNHAT